MFIFKVAIPNLIIMTIATIFFRWKVVATFTIGLQ